MLMVYPTVQLSDGSNLKLYRGVDGEWFYNRDGHRRYVRSNQRLSGIRARPAARLPRAQVHHQDIIDAGRTTQDHVLKMCPRGRRCGITIREPSCRLSEYRREYRGQNYRGKYYYAKVSDVKNFENRMLNICPCPLNVQRNSNAGHEPGWAYIIVPR